MILLVALLAGCATVARGPEIGSPEGDREVADGEVAGAGPDGSWRL